MFIGARNRVGKTRRLGAQGGSHDASKHVVLSCPLPMQAPTHTQTRILTHAARMGHVGLSVAASMQASNGVCEVVLFPCRPLTVFVMKGALA